MNLILIPCTTDGCSFCSFILMLTERPSAQINVFLPTTYTPHLAVTFPVYMWKLNSGLYSIKTLLFFFYKLKIAFRIFYIGMRYLKNVTQHTKCGCNVELIFFNLSFGTWKILIKRVCEAFHWLWKQCLSQNTN